MIDEWGKGAKYWTKTWNPVIGCKKVSEGCENCYAESMAKRFPSLCDENGGFTPHVTNSKKAPRSGVVFVGNMTDIFGEWNRDSQICMWIYWLHEKAVNLILTKRPQRLVRLCCSLSRVNRWYGITAENQARYDERTNIIRQFPCHISNRWISCEPLLSEINLRLDSFPVKWVVVGAESGANRRPCKLEWVESIVQQCQKTGTPVFVKQLDIDGKLVNDITKFPPELQIRQIPWNR